MLFAPLSFFMAAVLLRQLVPPTASWNMLSGTAWATREINFDPVQTFTGLEQSLDFFADFGKLKNKTTNKYKTWDYDATASPNMYADHTNLHCRFTVTHVATDNHVQ